MSAENSASLPVQGEITCYIYKSTRKEEMYVYLSHEDGFDELPDALKSGFGAPLFVMELQLHAERKLARAKVEDVIQALSDQGFYLQMPPKIDPDLHFGD